MNTLLAWKLKITIFQARNWHQKRRTPITFIWNPGHSHSLQILQAARGHEVEMWVGGKGISMDYLLHLRPARGQWQVMLSNVRCASASLLTHCQMFQKIIGEHWFFSLCGLWPWKVGQGHSSLNLSKASMWWSYCANLVNLRQSCGKLLRENHSGRTDGRTDGRTAFLYPPPGRRGTTKQQIKFEDGGFSSPKCTCYALIWAEPQH